tara:strand:+ start:537 stop:1619 length:1083 start_codon:yes stop_codon:yes gene_type:complete
MNGQMPDIGQIMKLAQQVASKIDPPEQLKDGKEIDSEQMTNMIGQISKSVGDVITPDMLAGLNKKKKAKSTQNTPRVPEKEIKESKISFDADDGIEETVYRKEPKKSKKKRIVEIESGDSSEEEDVIAPRTKDMSFTLSVTLEELYKGTKKKIAIRRQKLEPDGSYEEEKKKLSIKIEPGMIDEQTIRFNHMADEKQGYETGDIVVTLDTEEHPMFVRDGNNLIIEKEISFSDTFKPIIYVRHLNGTMMVITGDPFDIFNDEDEMLKKVPGAGMPINGEKNKYGDLFIRFKCVNNCKLNEETLKELFRIFPTMSTKPDDFDKYEIVEKTFELVTDSDLEFLETDSSDEDYETDSSEEESD